MEVFPFEYRLDLLYIIVLIVFRTKGQNGRCKCPQVSKTPHLRMLWTEVHRSLGTGINPFANITRKEIVTFPKVYLSHRVILLSFQPLTFQPIKILLDTLVSITFSIFWGIDLKCFIDLSYDVVVSSRISREFILFISWGFSMIYFAYI